MPRPLAILGGLVLLAGIALIACSGDSDATPTTTATATSEATPTAEAPSTVEPSASSTAVASTPTPEPVALLDGLPESAAGPLFVYAKEVGQTETSGRLWPRVAIVTYDLGTRRVVASFEVGTVGSYPTAVALAGREVIVNFEHSMYAYALNGDETRELIAPSPTGGQIQGALASPDGKLIAVGHARDDCDPICLEVIDLASGDLLLDLPRATPGLDTLGGVFAQPIVWRDDSGAVLVAGQPNGHQFFGWATVSLDGSVDNHGLDLASVSPAPDARHAITFEESATPWLATDIGCDLTTRIDLHDLGQDRELAQFTNPGSALSRPEWSPDGTELLLAWRTLPEGGRCDEGYTDWLAQPADWRLVDTSDGSSSSIAGPGEARQRWSSVHRLTLVCDGSDEDFGDRVGSCPDGSPIGVAIDGDIVDRVVNDVRLLGTIAVGGP